MSEQLDERTERKIRAGQTVRVVVFVVVVAALGAWAAANQDDVEVDWLLDTTTAPLVVVIAISTVAGFLLGALAVWRRRH